MPPFDDIMFLYPFVSYTSIVVVTMFIVVYTALYDWIKHPLGRLMNFSLMSTIIIASGAMIRGDNPTLGMTVATVGWAIFIILLISRLILLIKLRLGRSRRQYPEDVKAFPESEEDS